MKPLPETTQEQRESILDQGVATFGARGVIGNILGYAFGIYSLPVVVLAFFTSIPLRPFRVVDKYLHWWTKLWIEMQMILFGIKLRVDGLEHLDKDKTYVVAANHRSWMDAMAIILALKPYMNFVFIVKRSLLYIPIVGWYLKWAGYIGVNRGAPGRNQNSIQLAAEHVRKHWSVLIFPEGTRSKSHAFGRFRRGVVDLASSAEVEILPVVVSGSARLYPRGSPFIRPGPVRVEILPPLDPLKAESADQALKCLRLSIAKRYRLTADGAPAEEAPDIMDAILPRKP